METSQSLFRYFAVGLLVCVGALARPAKADIVDAIVATVDTEVILYSEILAEIQPRIQELRVQAPSQAEFDRLSDELLRATLEQAVESKILLREAQLLGLEVSDEQIDSQIKTFRAAFANEEFLRELEKAGETLNDFRERIRKQMVAQVMNVRKRRALESDVIVSESEVADFYAEHRADMTRPERVRVRQIFLRENSGDAGERAKATSRLGLILDELEAGADFGELAEAYSEAPGAEDGGIIGWQQRGDLVENLETAVFSKPAGAITGILETQGGVHILKIDQREDSGLASLEEVRGEINTELRRERAAILYEEWMKELRRRSRVQTFL